MKRLMTVGLGAMLAALVAVPFAPARGQQFATDLIFEGHEVPEAGQFRFYGEMNSPAGIICTVDRKVRIFFKQEGEDFLNSSTRTDSNGNWSMQGSGGANGTFYAKTPRKLLGQGDSCKRDKSNEITVP